ncbi:MAG: putrescine transport system permease protein [Actinomycetota bacterium]|nr:putrescine transport system permease protein [Actinomycetota bacterium]
MSHKSALRPRYLKLHAVLVFAFLFLPIGVLVFFSFNNARSGTDFTGFSTKWYSDLIHNHQALQAFRNTLKVAIAATVIATVIGTLASFALTRFKFRGRSAYSTLIFVSLVMPEVVMGVSLLAFYANIAHMKLGLTTVILAHTTFCIAFVVVVVNARLASFDNRLVEAAADLGATPIQTFLRVVLPLAAPGIAAGAMLAFTISLDDVVITFFTSGPGSTTLPLYIFSSLKFGVSPSINALSTFVLVFSLFLLALGGLFSARSAKRGVTAVDVNALG